MNNRLLLLLVVSLFLHIACFPVVAQNARIEARELEWQSYEIPSSPFTRITGPQKQFALRVPADWKHEVEGGRVVGPNAVTFEMFVENVPEGSPLADYVGGIVKVVSNLPGAAETTLIRRTLLQDVEAREIVLQMPDPAGEMSRTVVWLTIRGPFAIGLKFVAPLSQIGEYEPYFKAIVQSIAFGRSGDVVAFEALRASALKDLKPGPLREVQDIVSTVIANGVASETSIQQLTMLFSQNPDSALDLVDDLRPFVRLAAVEALVRSQNKTLDEFVWRALDDPEPLIASYAARSLANTPGVVAKLAERTFGGFRTETVARLWPFLSKDQRLQILQKIFSRPAVKPLALGPNSKVTVTVDQIVPVAPTSTRAELVTTLHMDNDPSVQLGALNLLRYTPVDDFKLPFSVILAGNQDTLTVAAMQVAIERREALSVNALLKLLTSANLEISGLAATSLGVSGTVSDLPRIQSVMDRSGRSLPERTVTELKLSIAKIRFRHELAATTKSSSAAEQATVKKGLADPQLSSFVWRYVCDSAPQRCGISEKNLHRRSELRIDSFGENLWPEEPLHFAAIPKPDEAIQKLYQSFQGIQMHSARAQSNFVLILGAVRQQVAQQLGAANGSSALFDYTGIHGDAPITVAGWTADGANPRIDAAQRHALLLRIRNRQQFERFVGIYQRQIGSFGDLPQYVAGVARFMPALPAILPITAKTILDDGPERPKPDRLLSMSAIRDEESNGFQIRVLEHTFINNNGRIETNASYIGYLGDAAVVAPNFETIREILRRATVPEPGERSLKDNPKFRQLINEGGGEVIYLSNLSDLIRIRESDSDPTISETGQLRLSQSTWETKHRLEFPKSDWSVPLSVFEPKDLTAPKSLLPSSTLAYFMVNVDLRAEYINWSAAIQKEIKNLSSPFALDFEGEFLQNLGPECGVAVLEWPDFTSSKDLVWLAFLKLKNEKVREALRSGLLFSGVGPTTGPAEVKFNDNAYVISVRNDFLVVSNNKKGLSALDSAGFLAATADYSKSVAKTPGQVVLFGGYNLTSAIEATKRESTHGLQQRFADILLSITEAFHSQSIFATASSGSIEAQASVSMDREGRYAVADINYTKSSERTYVTVQADGIPINDQKRLNKVVLRIRSKAGGAIEAIKKDVAFEGQNAEQNSAEELLLTVEQRKKIPDQKILLPITAPSMSQFLAATREIQSTSPDVIKQAREIAGDDKDAWVVARKLADWTHKNLQWKLISDADANQTLATREADCSEFSQLYVAMARSLGLPARIVSGLAYGGSTFGGHAWVEVWCGKWIELDPTWGTDFVDATHIRSDANDLIAYAALDAIDIDVLETHRTVAEFQQTPGMLVEQLIKTVPKRNSSALEAAVSLELLTHELMGAGEWERLSTVEREQLTSALHRAIIEVLVAHSPDPGTEDTENELQPSPTESLRLLRIDESADRAVATCYYEPDDALLKVTLKRLNGAWYLVEFAQTDLDYQIFAETFQPTIETIQARRAGKMPHPAVMSDYSRAVVLFETNVDKSLEILEGAIKANPSMPRLPLLKASALMARERDDDEAEAKKLMAQLANKTPPYGPAINMLAQWYRFSEDEGEKTQVIDLLNRHLRLEPADIRAYAILAGEYLRAGDATAAEAALRKVIELDPRGKYGYIALAQFLAIRGQLPAVSSVLVEAAKPTAAAVDIFDSVIDGLQLDEEYEALEQLAASQPLRVRGSALANLALASFYVDTDRPLKALPLLKLAADLDKKSAVPYLRMAEAYRKLSRWTLALEATNKALMKDHQSAAAHYQRACIYARLRRTNEALAELKRAVEFGSYYSYIMANEKDLASLASLEEFKKLVKKLESEEP